MQQWNHNAKPEPKQHELTTDGEPSRNPGFRGAVGVVTGKDGKIVDVELSLPIVSGDGFGWLKPEQVLPPAQFLSGADKKRQSQNKHEDVFVRISVAEPISIAGPTIREHQKRSRGEKGHGRKDLVGAVLRDLSSAGAARGGSVPDPRFGRGRETPGSTRGRAQKGDV